MTAQIYNLAVERPIRTLNKALDLAEARSAEAFAELARQREILADLWIDPRAREFLVALREHFAGSASIVAEIDHVKSLLRPPPGIIQ